MSEEIHKLYRKYFGDDTKKDSMTGELYYISDKKEKIVVK